MIFNKLLTKYLIRKGVRSKIIFVGNKLTLAILYSILYRFFYLHFDQASSRISIGVLYVLAFLFILVKINKTIKNRKII